MRLFVVNPYFLKYYARVERIDFQPVFSGGNPIDVDSAEGITAKDVPPPFRREVVGMYGEDLGRAVVQLDGIARVPALIHVKGRQGTDLDAAIAVLEVKLILDARSLVHIIIRRSIERQYHHSVAESELRDCRDSARAALADGGIPAGGYAKPRLGREGRINADEDVVDTCIGL